MTCPASANLISARLPQKARAMRPSSLIPLLMLLCAAPLGAQTCLPDVPKVAPDARYTVVNRPGTEA